MNRSRSTSVLAFAAVLANSAPAAPLRLGVVSDGGRPGFAEALRVGLTQGARELEKPGEPIAIEWREPAKLGDRSAQTRLVDEFVAAHVDVILLDAIDRQVLRAPVEKAALAGVPVVAVDSGVDGDAAARVVATDNRAAGREAARLLGKLLGGRGGVLLLRYQIHAAKTEQREEGFIEAITREFPHLKLVASDYHAGATIEAATNVSLTLLQRYAGQIDGVFASSETGSAGMLAALRRAPLAAGKVKFVGSDEGGGGLEPALRSGEAQGFIADDPLAMGRAAANAAVALARHTKPVSAAAVDFTVVTAAGRASPSIEPVRAAAEVRAPFECPSCRPSDRTREPDKAKHSFTIPDLDLAMLALAPGTFGRSVRATVTLTRACWLGQCEVTQRQWTRLMDSNPSNFRGDCLPVDNIAWPEATEFCRRLTVRESAAGRLPDGYAYTLPTEAQWEYAARAGSPIVVDDDVLLDSTWCATTSGAVQPESGVWRMSTHPVGTKRANAWGFFDLGGNVAEWCLDWEGELPAESATDPHGPVQGTYRVLRGGSWWADVQNCRADSRHRAPPTRHHDGLGMRVALSAISS